VKVHVQVLKRPTACGASPARATPISCCTRRADIRARGAQSDHAHPYARSHAGFANASSSTVSLGRGRHAVPSTACGAPTFPAGDPGALYESRLSLSQLAVRIPTTRALPRSTVLACSVRLRWASTLSNTTWFRAQSRASGWRCSATTASRRWRSPPSSPRSTSVT
jgi:hypothetical protein